jgi:hypothetical protein
MAFQDYPAFSSTPTYQAASRAARRSRIASVAFVVAALIWIWAASLAFSTAQDGDEQARLALAIALVSVVLDLIAASLAWVDRARLPLRIYAVVRTFLALGGISWATMPAYLVAVVALPPRDDYRVLRSVPHLYRPKRPPLVPLVLTRTFQGPATPSDPPDCVCGLPKSSDLHIEAPA